MTYEEALAYVASLAPRGWRLGLDRMFELARHANLTGSLGEPGGPQFIHVAGTNGKGSVTAFVQSILTQAGYRTGGFFSPYVYDPRERIQHDNELIPRQDFASMVEHLMPIAESMSSAELGEVSEFEFKTAMGFEFWKRKACDWVALEVGIGGRLDSTNIVTPRCSVITSISFDHTSILGNSLAEIAAEKAGIIKPCVPVVVGDLPAEAMEVVVARARACESPVLKLGMDFPPRLEVKGLRNGQNAALAIAAIEAAGIGVDDQAIDFGLRTARLPGRYERRTYGNIEVLFDGAHNGAASEELADRLREDFPGRRFVLLTGMVGGHDHRAFYKPLAQMVNAAHVSPINFHRGVPPEELAQEVSESIDDTTAYRSIADAVRGVLAECRTDDLLLVTGSFYLLGEAVAALESRA